MNGWSFTRVRGADELSNYFKCYFDSLDFEEPPRIREVVELLLEDPDRVEVIAMRATGGAIVGGYTLVQGEHSTLRGNASARELEAIEREHDLESAIELTGVWIHPALRYGHAFSSLWLRAANDVARRRVWTVIFSAPVRGGGLLRLYADCCDGVLFEGGRPRQRYFHAAPSTFLQIPLRYADHMRRRIGAAPHATL